MGSLAPVTEVDLSLYFERIGGAPVVQAESQVGRDFLAAQAGPGCTGMTLDGIEAIPALLVAARRYEDAGREVVVACYGLATFDRAEAVEVIHPYHAPEGFAPILIAGRPYGPDGQGVFHLRGVRGVVWGYALPKKLHPHYAQFVAR